MTTSMMRVLALVVRVVDGLYFWSDGAPPRIPMWSGLRSLRFTVPTSSSHIIIHSLYVTELSIYLPTYPTQEKTKFGRDAVPRAVLTRISPASGCFDKPRRRLLADALTLAPRLDKGQGSLIPVSRELIPRFGLRVGLRPLD